MMTSEALFYWGVQALGLLAAAVAFFGYTHKDDRILRALMAFSALIFAAHYTLLGALTTAAVLTLSAFRQAISGWVFGRSLRTRVLFTLIFMVALAWISALTWQGPQSILPALAIASATWIFFWTKGRVLRKGMVATDAMLCVNALLVGSLSGFVMHLAAVVLSLKMFHTLRRLEAPAR